MNEKIPALQPLPALIAIAIVILAGEGIKILLKSVTFTSFGGSDVNTMMAVAAGVILAPACIGLASRFK